MATRWYRAYEGTVSDPKLGEVAIVANCSRSVVVAAWHAILENAASLNDGGNFDAPPRRVAAALGEPVATIEAVFAGLADVGLVSDGQVTAWQRRQYESDSSTERSRKHRQRQGNGDATLQQRPHSTETETETEKLAAATRERGEDSSQINRLNRILGFSEGDFSGFVTNLRTLTDLKAEGCDFERHILPAAERAAKGGRAKSLAYIAPKARELRDAAATVAAMPAPFENTDERGWKARLTAFQDKAMWSPKWGPKPDEAGCKCPAEFLKKDAA